MIAFPTSPIFQPIPSTLSLLMFLSLKAPLFLVPISNANCVTHYNSTSGLPGTPGLVWHQQLKLTSAVCAVIPIRHQVETRADRGSRWWYYLSDIFWLLESLTLTLLLLSSPPLLLPNLPPLLPTLLSPLPPLLPQLTAFSPLSTFPTLLSTLPSLPSLTKSKHSIGHPLPQCVSDTQSNLSNSPHMPPNALLSATDWVSSNHNSSVNEQPNNLSEYIVPCRYRHDQQQFACLCPHMLCL